LSIRNAVNVYQLPTSARNRDE